MIEVHFKCDCGNETETGKPSKYGELEKFNISVIKENDIIIGLSFLCMKCGYVRDDIFEELRGE